MARPRKLPLFPFLLLTASAAPLAAAAPDGRATFLEAHCAGCHNGIDRKGGLDLEALAFKPDDPAILDSLGWVYYRIGELSRAENYLRQAWQSYPDAEIAAHLGEVLWIQGKQQEARDIWSQSLKQQPDSTILRRTMQRLIGSESP